MLNLERTDQDTAKRFGSHGMTAIMASGLVALISFVVMAYFFGSFLPLQLIVILSLFFAFVAGGYFLMIFNKKQQNVAANEARTRQAIKEAETQKQIDAMQRKASNIPKVTR